MFATDFAPRPRHAALSLLLVSAGIASAEAPAGSSEAGFSRVKVAFRARCWKDDPAAIPAFSSFGRAETVADCAADGD